jgi:hypothetical protein
VRENKNAYRVFVGILDGKTSNWKGRAWMGG